MSAPPKANREAGLETCRLSNDPPWDRQAILALKTYANNEHHVMISLF